MATTAALSEHDVLPAEVLGDTLIVTPHGDLLSHDYREFRAELTMLKRALQKPELKHVIVDLSGSDYFGSQMIGGLIELKNELDPEGRAVLCDLSDSQKHGLRILHIEEEFELAPTRQDAVQAVTRLGFRDHLRKLRRPTSLVLLVALFWGFLQSPWSYRIFSEGLDDKYERLAALWLEYREGGPEYLSIEEQLHWEENFQRKVATTRGLMSDRRWYMTDEARLLGEAAAALDDIVQKRKVNRYADFILNMRTVRTHLAERSGLEVTVLRRPPPKKPLASNSLSNEDAPTERFDDHDEVTID